MSGHSHYSTIKRQKESKDAQKGQIFSKMARALTIAVKTGGSSDPESNYKLRMAIDTARTYNMPKENIERAITRAASEAENIEEVMYEGFGPGGISIIVEAATDNRNRTSQEIKNIFERGGGSMAGPGSVSFNFEQKGLLIIKKKENIDEQMLSLIDVGAEDVEDSQDGIEMFVTPHKMHEIRLRVEKLGFEIISSSLIMKPKNYQSVTDTALAQKAINCMENLDNHDDVQRVYSNLDVSDEVLSKIMG